MRAKNEADQLALAMVTACAMDEADIILDLWRDTPEELRPRVVLGLAAIACGATRLAAEHQHEELFRLLERCGIGLAEDG